MGKSKHLKKACLYFVLSMVLVASLTGCRRKVKLRSDRFSEWVNAIRINEYPNVSCWAYHEYKNGLKLYIECFNFESGYEEFKKVIANHNAFVTRNPDYFPEDFDINIVLKEESQYEPLYFSNCTDSDLDKGTGEYCSGLSVIETEKTHRMRYAFPDNMEAVKNKFETEVIVGSLGQFMLYQTGKARNMSEHFENFDIMVIEISSEVEEKEDLEKIQQANPDAEIYYIIYTTYPDEYEIKKFTPNENSN